MDVDKIGLRQEFITPDILKQHGSRDCLAWPAHKIFKQPDLRRQEVQNAFASSRRTRDEVKLQRPDPQLGDRVIRPSQ